MLRVEVPTQATGVVLRSHPLALLPRSHSLGLDMLVRTSIMGWVAMAGPFSLVRIYILEFGTLRSSEPNFAGTLLGKIGELPVMEAKEGSKTSVR